VKLIVGVDVGREVLRALVSSRRRVWIASPYVSLELIDTLPRVDDGRVLVSEQSLEIGIVDAMRRAGYEVRILKGLHAKMYVADDVAIVGSMNFTLWGLYTNYEVAVISYSGEELFDEVVKAFETLWSIADLKRVP